MPFPPPRDHKIPLAVAVAMTKRYRASVKPGASHAGLFPNTVFTTLLSQEGCAGIRTYLGCHEDGSVNLIMVAVDADGRDIVPVADGPYQEGEVVQDSLICPPFCDEESPLNGG